jgi:hypothetical protein
MVFLRIFRFFEDFFRIFKKIFGLFGLLRMLPEYISGGILKLPTGCKLEIFPTGILIRYFV